MNGYEKRQVMRKAQAHENYLKRSFDKIMRKHRLEMAYMEAFKEWTGRDALVLPRTIDGLINATELIYAKLHEREIE